MQTLHAEIMRFLNVLGFRVPSTTTGILASAIEISLVKMNDPKITSNKLTKDIANFTGATINNVNQRLFKARLNYITLYPNQVSQSPLEMVYYLANKFMQMRGDLEDGEQ